jgi:dienelactone hydrolase
LQDVRSALLARLGPLPKRAAAAPPVVDRSFVWDGIRFERWTARGPNNEALPAWFLIQEAARGPRPTLLAFHPHGRQFEIGKSWVVGLVGEASRAYGLAAARAGFAVLAPDMPAFEDRRPPLTARKANYALQGEAYERLLAMNAIVQGATLQGKIVAEIAAWIDVLEEDGRVHAGRIGAIGHSFGGQEVVFAMLCEPRIRGGLASCGMSLVRLLVERSISHNMALYIPGLLPDLDFDRLVSAIAPRALYVLAGKADAIYPIDGVLAIEARAREAFRAQGAEDALRVVSFEGGHDLLERELEEALTWLGARI